MNPRRAPSDVRVAIDDLVLAAEQLHLMVARAAYRQHPLHPALARFAEAVLHAATRALNEAAVFVERESAPPAEGGRP